MKAKLLLMLFLVSLSLGVFASEHHQKANNTRLFYINIHATLFLFSGDKDTENSELISYTGR